ncbi:Ras-related protein RABG3a [Zea mays]|uniref:Ras-related protein RABG3a n=1 Tax=Zea mays TaxID=4577 RepID=A0A1D6MIB2_MAIZE|nr:Ras-related protein RABG3a [Zea mays]ONM29163.1 Ras-related protein RABG3a [Zea mays]ONM29171.1 Ras-related protein RABG3a [Zea mays]ONM29172.1 Ras-related protein RABG3a [Zea mays]
MAGANGWSVFLNAQAFSYIYIRNTLQSLCLSRRFQRRKRGNGAPPRAIFHTSRPLRRRTTTSTLLSYASLGSLWSMSMTKTFTSRQLWNKSRTLNRQADVLARSQPFPGRLELRGCY